MKKEKVIAAAGGYYILDCVYILPEPLDILRQWIFENLFI